MAHLQQVRHEPSQWGSQNERWHGITQNGWGDTHICRVTEHAVLNGEYFTLSTIYQSVCPHSH